MSEKLLSIRRRFTDIVYYEHNVSEALSLVWVPEEADPEPTTWEQVVYMGS